MVRSGRATTAATIEREPEAVANHVAAAWVTPGQARIGRFDLHGLDAHAADLHLVVAPAEVMERTVDIRHDDVARPIKPPAVLPENCESLAGELLVAAVAAA